MIEVYPFGGGWGWRWICAAGRTLVECAFPFASDREAFAAAKAYRAQFLAAAAQIDHRSEACR